MHQEIQSRNLNKNPDGVRKFSNDKMDIANLGDATIARITAEPSWRWSMISSPKPIQIAVNLHIQDMLYQEDCALGWMMERNKNLVQAKHCTFHQVMTHGSLEMSLLLQWTLPVGRASLLPSK